MNDTVKEKTPVVPAQFCKGQMPAALVWYIKFFEEGENKSAIAKKYFTTSGKIADIQSDSNQKYIVKDMNWSDEELDKAIESIKANFTRGHDLREDMSDEAWDKFVEANKRKVATTTLEDAEYSLEVIETIRDMDPSKDGVTLAEARSTYNAENPRKKATKTETKTETEEPVTEEDVDAVDDLLD